MEKAFEFLKSHNEVAFATVDGGKPKIRVFQIMRQEGRTLFFATSPRKEVYNQLRTNPDIEILCMAGNIFVRAAGKATFDVDDQTAREIYPSCRGSTRSTPTSSTSGCLWPSSTTTTSPPPRPSKSTTNMDRIENLRFIVRSLLNERQEAEGDPLPNSLPQLQTMMRALLNVRPPAPISDAILMAQDAELQWQLRDKGAVGLQDIATNTKNELLRLWQGDITLLRVDAIVNAANSALLGCFVPMHRCIDNAIHSAAGVQLRLECERIMKEQGTPEPTGRAKMTGGYNLPARHVIHTVGPIVRGVKASPNQEKELEDCYRSCLRIADEHGLRSIAFCCISTGEFGFPPQRAAEIAVRTVSEYLGRETETHIGCVIFNVFKDSDYAIYRELLQ